MARTKLGYIPSLDNVVILRLLGKGEKLEALIAKLQESSHLWGRVEAEVRWVM